MIKAIGPALVYRDYVQQSFSTACWTRYVDRHELRSRSGDAAQLAPRRTKATSSEFLFRARAFRSAAL
jgi:hypothetical protein